MSLGVNTVVLAVVGMDGIVAMGLFLKRAFLSANVRSVHRVVMPMVFHTRGHMTNIVRHARLIKLQIVLEIIDTKVLTGHRIEQMKQCLMI